MKEKKLNVLLAVTDQLRHYYKSMISDYTKFFANNQGSFKGEKKTYVARDGVVDEPKKRGVVKVATTVPEKLDYFVDNSSPFIDALFSQEKTNSSGTAKAELIVDGNVWGTFTSLELLRLKSLLESNDTGDLGSMIEKIPVRKDSVIWSNSKSEDYTGRKVYENNLDGGEAKTTVKESHVLLDPNLKGKELPINYTPPIAQKDAILVLGDYTRQEFSGEWSHQERALCLRRRTTLLTAITQALKAANDCEAIKSEITAKRIFDYLFYNK